MTDDVQEAPDAGADGGTQEVEQDTSAQADVVTEGDKPEVEGTTDGEKETQTAKPEEVFEVSIPDGMEPFEGAFTDYQGAMGGWLKDNPDASASDALAEAARYQSALVKDQVEAHEKQVADWANDLKADKEIGGSAYDENVAIAVKGINAFGSDGLKSLLDETGLGNHPEIVRTFMNVGKRLEDGKIIETTAPEARRSLADAMYPGMSKG